MKTEKEKREEEEEDLRPFRIHAYSKEELAMLYNPTYCISNAIYTLAAWIRHNKALKGELEKVGYNKYRRTFTPLEVKVLVKYLGRTLTGCRPEIGKPCKENANICKAP